MFKGRGSVTFESRTYDVHAGDLYLLPAGIAHSYDSDPDEPMGQVWIEFDGGDSEEILRSVVDQLGPIVQDEISDKIASKMTYLIQKLIIVDYYECAVLIYQILLDLMFEKNNMSQKDPTEKTSRIQMAKRYIDAHITEKITNEELADVCGLSLSYFMKSFKETYNHAPQDYMMRQKIETVRHYLSHTDKSVEEIAFQFAFCTTSHLIKRFKKYVGVTPAKYRKNSKHVY